MTEQIDDKLKTLDEVAKAAIKLLSPPYKRGGGICLESKKELEDWEHLRKALMKADYCWEEYT